MGIELHFLGGAETVTGSQFLVRTSRARVLVDCGMFQGSPNESIRNRVPFGYDPATLDAVLLTHAHLDHCGLLPVLVRGGYPGRIYTTAATAELAMIVLLDSGRLHERYEKREARWEARHPDKALVEDREEAVDFLVALRDALVDEEPDSPLAALAPDEIVFLAGSVGTGEHVATTIEANHGRGLSAEPASPQGAPGPPRDPEAALRAAEPTLTIDLDAPLYTERDAAAVAPRFKSVRYGKPIEVAPGIVATLEDAGHILGSAIIRLEICDAPHDEPRTIVFSGDLGRPGAPILRDPTRMTGADYVVVESTYGGREHEPAREAIGVLRDVVRAVSDAGGVLLIPSFAIGRTQELVWQLDRLVEAGEIPLLPLYLDSPMGSRATAVYKRHPELYDESTSAINDAGGTPFDYPRQTVTLDAAGSKAIERAKRPYMIVASNGMLTGGRVVEHLRNLIDDPDATILFVGYQGEGTLGSHLQAGATHVRLDGEQRTVRCRIRSIGGFSAHADEPALLAWLGAFAEGRLAGSPGRPRRIFLVHGDPEAQVALEPKVRALGFATHVPAWHEAVTLD